MACETKNEKMEYVQKLVQLNIISMTYVDKPKHKRFMLL